MATRRHHHHHHRSDSSELQPAPTLLVDGSNHDGDKNGKKRDDPPARLFQYLYKNCSKSDDSEDSEEDDCSDIEIDKKSIPAATATHVSTGACSTRSVLWRLAQTRWSAWNIVKLTLISMLFGFFLVVIWVTASTTTSTLSLLLRKSRARPLRSPSSVFPSSGTSSETHSSLSIQSNLDEMSSSMWMATLDGTAQMQEIHRTVTQTTAKTISTTTTTASRPHGSEKPSSPLYIPEIDGPPADLYLHGKLDKYTPCPPEYRKHAFIASPVNSNIQRAFSALGWRTESSSSSFYAGKHHILYRKSGVKSGTQVGKPWQRYSRIPGVWKYLDSKAGFVAGFQQYQYDQQQRAAQQGTTSNDKNHIYFLPETYRLGIARDVKAFTKAISKNNGRNRPWVLKQTRQSRGRGVEMLAPNSEALDTAVARSLADGDNNYIVQAYVCNELTWFQKQKFDLRFYWMVASVDPLIVLYHDGFVRVGDAAYNETDFASTTQHLTNSAYKEYEEEDVRADALWRRIRQHYESDRDRLSQIIVGEDPVRHVRNQIKEAISTTVEAFYDNVFSLEKYPNVTTENLFSFYGADFIIDEDLDVFYVEAQDGPQMKDTHDFRIDLYRKMVRPMIQLVEEIAVKQETDAKANILPLQNLGEWEIVYAGKDQWRYQFPEYQRSTQKKGCSLGR